MGTPLPQHPVAIKNYSTSHSGKWWLCSSALLVVAFLISLSGDVETNPGPLCDTCEHIIDNTHATNVVIRVNVVDLQLG